MVKEVNKVKLVSLNASSITPLYQQVKQYLEQLISTGDLSPGDQLPSERELEEKFGVSRITVRRALQEMVNEEKISRIPGKGSFLLEPKIEPLTALTSFSENMRARGRAPSYRGSTTGVIVPPSQVATALNLLDGEEVFHLFRLMFADQVPMAIQNAYLPERIYSRDPTLFAPDVLNALSLYKILEVELGIQLFRAEEQVDASLANREEAELLKVQVGSPVIVVKRTTFDVNERAVEFVKLVFPAERYRYKVELFRPKKWHR